MLVAVRASAPVAAMPPKKGARMLPRPRPISSASGSWRLPVMPSATTADKSDSIAPSIAIVNAAGRSARIVAKSRVPAVHGHCGSGGSGGMPAIRDTADARVEAVGDRGDVDSRRHVLDERRADGDGGDRDERAPAPGS